jgi:uncharacterized protein (TIGR02996 family)
MTAPELRSLIQGCKDAPDDDLPRLVLADWLEENGEGDRAEFVRLSVRLSAQEIPLGDEAVTLARLHELYSRNADRWLGGLDPHGGVTFERGLIRLRCPLPVLRALGDSADVTPWLETLAFDRRFDQGTGDLLTAEALAHFSGLEVGRLTGAHLQRLGGDVRAAGLRRLRVELTGSGSVVAAALALCDQLGGLRSLEVPAGLGDVPLQSMASAAWIRGLTLLAIERGGSLRQAAPVLARSPARLAHVNWAGVQIGTTRLRQLATSHLLADVVDLRLVRAGLTAHDVRALARRPTWPRLRRLDLTDNLLADDGLKELAALGLPSLRRLVLARNRLTPAGLRELVAAPWCDGLEWLDLSDNRDLGDEGARVLAEAASLANLRRLNLGACELTASGSRALAQSPHLARLQTLWLAYNQVGTAGLTALAESGALPALTALGLHSISASPDGVARLGRSRLAERLGLLDLSTFQPHDETFAALASSRLANLKDLRLNEMHGTPERAAALARAPFAGLVRLSMMRTEGTLPALLGTHGFASLSLLHLGRSAASSEEKAALRAWPRLPHLAWLTVGDVSGDETIRRLASPVAFPT